MKNGIATLLTILTISAVALAISVSLTKQTIDTAYSLRGSDDSSKATQIAQGCLEEAMLRIKNANFTSPMNLSYGEGSCDILITSTGTNLYEVSINSTISNSVGTFNRSITAGVQSAGQSVVLLSWQLN